MLAGPARAVTGSITADPQIVYVTPGGTGSTTVSWSSDDPQADVVASVNGQTGSVIAQGQSGSIGAPYIPQGTTTFSLVDDVTGAMIDSVSVQGVLGGTIAASETTVAVPAGGTGATTISWSTAEADGGQVWVSVNGAPEQLFASGRTGSMAANWIPQGATVFTLYAGTGHAQALAAVTVTGSASGGSGGGGGACDRSPVTGDARISVGPGRRTTGAGHLSASYGQRVRISGRVTGADGRSIPRGRVCVVPRDAQSGTPAPTATLTSDSHGRFSYVLQANRPLVIEFVYRTGSGAASTSMLLRVGARLSLHASPSALRNGGTVVLSGTVRGLGLPRNVLVDFQARKGPRWQHFGLANANAHGRFHFTYQFLNTFSRQVYTIRARVPVQPEVPFAGGASQVVKIRVSP